LTIFEKVNGPDHPDVASSLNNLAELYRTQGRYADAEPLFKRSIAIRESKLGAEHPNVATSLNGLALLYKTQGRYADAEPLYKRSLAILEKVNGQDHPDVATALNNLAALYQTQGPYADAEPLYKRSLAIRESKLGADHPDVAISLGSLASLYVSQGRYADAEPLFKRSLAIQESKLGADHPDVATSLNDLASLYVSQGRYADAEPLFKRSLAISEKVNGPDHPDVALSLNNLAALYKTQGRYADAEPLYKRSLAIRESKLGADHPDVASSLNNLAMLYASQGRYADAEPLYKRSLAIRESKLGADHPDVATALNNLAGLSDSQGRYADAEPLYKRSLAIRESKLGADHPNVATSLNGLALLYKTQGRYADAEPLYKRSLAILEKVNGQYHPDVATALNNLAELYRTQGRYADAEPLYKRSLAIQESKLGADHPDVATSLNNLAELYRTQGRYADAEPLYKRSLTIRESKLGADHPAVATALNNLALLYDSQGRYADAEPLFKRSLAIRESKLGADHPDVATPLNNLALLHASQGRYADAEPLFKRSLSITENRLGVRREIDPFAKAAQRLRFQMIPCHKFMASDSSREELAILQKLQANALPDVMPEFERILSVRKKESEKPESSKEASQINEAQIGETQMQVAIAFETMGGSSKELALKAIKPISSLAQILLTDTAGKVTGSSAYSELGGIEPAKSFSATSLMVLGNLLAANSEESKAKEAFKLSESCFLAQVKPDQQPLIQNLLILSEAWLNLGDYSKSLEVVSKAATLAKDSADSLLIYHCLLATAKIALEQADYSEALIQGNEALKAGKALATAGQLKDSASSLCSCYKILAEVSSAQGNNKESKQFASEVLQLTGLSKQDQAYCLVLLGSAQLELKEYEGAKKSLNAATALNDTKERSLEQSTFTQAATILGNTLIKLGALKDARYQFNWALSWDKNNPGSEGLLATARDYNGLANVEMALVAAKDKEGDKDRARYYSLEAAKCIDKYIKTAFPNLSLGQQCAFLAIAKQQSDALLSVCYEPEHIGPAYSYMMKWKGLLLESLRYKGASKLAAIKALKSNNTELATTQAELDAQIKLLAGIANKGDDTAGADKENSQNKYRQETSKKERLEREVSSLAGVSLNDPLDSMGSDSFRNLLKPNEAFIDIVAYKPFTQDQERYAAIAMKSQNNCEAAMFDLGEKTEIDEFVRQWRYGVTGETAELTRDSIPVVDAKTENDNSIFKQKFADNNHKLSDLLLSNKNMQTYLGPTIKRIWLCPEGDIGRVPWSAIATIAKANGTESSLSIQTISEVDSPREFASLRIKNEKLADTDNHLSNNSASNNSISNRSKMLLAGLSDFGKANLNKLDGALTEVKQIKTLAETMHRTIEPLFEDDATKESVKTKLTEVTVAHIATHGFASGDSTDFSSGGDTDASSKSSKIANADVLSPNSSPTRKPVSRSTRPALMTMRAGGGMKLASARNPLSDCGLFFAYPKDQADSEDAPNILTADEIIGLDLSKCDIVTLSACQTGLGRRLNGQGVIGLRSAIIGAGAKSVLMSLWSVPDIATQELMKRFYTNLWEKKMSKQAALADAQDYVRNQKDWAAPKNWAAWVLVGE
nr:tetratricopeptide repeat protein [bacterium]